MLKEWSRTEPSRLELEDHDERATHLVRGSAFSPILVNGGIESSRVLMQMDYGSA